MKKHISYLKSKEWSLGQGQCPECLGCRPDFDINSSIIYREEGHETNCKVAEIFLEENVEVVYCQMNIQRYYFVKKYNEDFFRW